MQNRLTEAIICIVGLGYVGLPLAEAFSRHFKVIGFDTNAKLTKELGLHSNNKNLSITNSPRQIKQADFIIITVPTPVTKSKEPDLSYIEDASEIVSQNMRAGCTVILESTVYPGVTEEVMRPILEKSGFKCGQDFKIAYSPERIYDINTVSAIRHIIQRLFDKFLFIVCRYYYTQFVTLVHDYPPMLPLKQYPRFSAYVYRCR